MIRVGYARNMARKLIKDMNIKAPPVLIEEVAKFAGLDVIPYDFAEEVSGVLVVSDSLKAIGVNKIHATVRQRFSIAHELGHYMLGHNDYFFLDFSDSALENLSRDEIDKDAEIEANEFAAELLMPSELIKEDYKVNKMDPKVLAERYKVSEQALWIKLVNMRMV
jgi:Zn-dependent peptidase ImmA (M78 family)